MTKKWGPIIGWNGGECPVSGDTVVCVWYRGGKVGQGTSDRFDWSHSDRDSELIYLDIIAYCISRELKHRTVYLEYDALSLARAGKIRSRDDTHRITFAVIDGEIDCDSVRMEKFHETP